jgi:hypothetical protein
MMEQKSLKATTGAVTLLIGTRKGGFVLKSDAARKQWKTSAPIQLGNIVNHIVADPRDKRIWLMAARAGHLGPTVMRSTDGGKKWQEASKPPAFPPVAEGKKGLTVDHVFWLTPSNVSEPGVWYTGTSPQGLFRSDDDGDTWHGVEGFNANPNRGKWVGDESQDAPPDGATLHSINVDPRDASHLYISMSIGGTFESRDRGASWQPINRGVEALFNPDPDPEYGHDVHCMRLSADPDVMYQQNHCGIYRLQKPETRWTRIGNNMPIKIGDIGFPIALHPRDADTLWVFPMDGGSVWPRVALEGKPAVYASKNGGKIWQRLVSGMPEKNAWWTVKRQALTTDAHDPVGIYFGTTSGEVWASRDQGKRWSCIARHLPHIYSLETATKK